MFSYDVRPFVLPNPTSKLLGFCDLIIDNSVVVTGFKIFRNDKGELFASPPSQKGAKPDDKGNDQYFDTCRFIDAKADEKDKHTPLQKEILDAMVAAFRTASSTTRGTTSNKTTTATSTPATQSKKQRNPLWDREE